MAKTFTQKNLVTVNFGDSEADSYSDGPEFDQQMKDMMDQLKNLRVRPSISISNRIMEYATASRSVNLN